jgi:vacuolar-type H+-ATPase subunit B/Vma2
MQTNLLTLSGSSSDSSAAASRLISLEAENKRLQEDLATLQQETSLKSSRSGGGLSRSDHLAYVNQLHDVYRQEIEKTQAEKREVESKAQAGLEELRDKLRALEDQLLAEKGAKVQALNELTYKRIELEKLQDDFLSKVRDLRKGYEERICGQQKDIIDRDAQIETFNLKIGEYQ